MKLIWACPLCQSHATLKLVDRGRLGCSKGHSFDIAREGYVNLLPVNKKKTKEPGDNKESVKARRAFLDEGFYQPLYDTLARIIKTRLNADAQAESRVVQLLDCGCGEGSLLSYLDRTLAPIDGVGHIKTWGLDISKPAVRSAAKRGRRLQMAVGSSFNFPLPSNAMDGVIRVLAPGDDRELIRVLRKSGWLLLVTPGPRHLFGLRSLMYQTPVPHEISEKEPAGFTLESREELHYEIQLPKNQDIMNLLSMTPYYWSMSKEAKTRMQALTELKTEVEFDIRLLRKE